MKSLDQQILKSILSLLKEGKIMAECYKCKFPISKKEVEISNCDQCGQIDVWQVLFKKIDPDNFS